jgi:hypothetical protein
VWYCDLVGAYETQKPERDCVVQHLMIARHALVIARSRPFRLLRDVTERASFNVSGKGGFAWFQLATHRPGRACFLRVPHHPQCG